LQDEEFDEPQGKLLGQRTHEETAGSNEGGTLYGQRFATRRQAIDEVIEWLTFYNPRCFHSTLGYISPMQYEKHWEAAQQLKVA
jgi:transposase InsO family protein